jgi:integral membrane protein
VLRLADAASNSRKPLLRRHFSGKCATPRAPMNNLQLLRRCTWLEGSSYLALLFIAMPMKYLLQLPLAVRIVGSLHGLLFIAFVALLLRAAREQRWNFKQVALLFLGSLIPGSMWWMDRRMSAPSP